MNIGLLTAYLDAGDSPDSGIGRHFRILADALTNEGHRVHLVIASTCPVNLEIALQQLVPRWTWEVVSAPLPRVIDRISARNWLVRLMAQNLWLSRAAAGAVQNAHRRLELQILETHSYNTPGLLLLSRRHRPRVVTRVSTTARQGNAFSPVKSRLFAYQAALERAAIRRSDALVTHTQQHRDVVCAEERCSPSRFAIVPHGIPDPGWNSAENPEDTAAVEFLYVGRFEPRKGTDVLFAALPTVARACPDARFTVAGSNEGGDLWQRFAQQHPNLAASHVRCLGRVQTPELDKLYRRCSVMVAPSRYESFGLMYIEAMSRGKPVIGCSVGGVPEVIRDGITGRLATAGDPASLANCMIELARDGAKRRRMGDAARRDFCARFSATQLAVNSVALYRRIEAGTASP